MKNKKVKSTLRKLSKKEGEQIVNVLFKSAAEDMQDLLNVAQTNTMEAVVKNLSDLRARVYTKGVQLNKTTFRADFALVLSLVAITLSVASLIWR